MVLFVRTVGSETVDFLTSHPECQACKILEETVRYEREQKEHYLNLLHTRVGLKSVDESVDEKDWTSVTKTATLTQLRRDAVNNSRLARDKEKTPAERLFEEKLNEVKKEPIQ